MALFRTGIPNSNVLTAFYGGEKKYEKIFLQHARYVSYGSGLLLIFGCMASASAASVRAEEQMEIQTAMKAEGTTAQTMTGTAGGANEQVIQETVEETADKADTPKQEETGDAQNESAGREENGGFEADQEPSGVGSSVEKVLRIRSEAVSKEEGRTNLEMRK